MRYVDRMFDNQTVELDGNQFEGCTFVDCRLVFSATDRVSFTRCKFTDCDWSFEGPAETMLFFLSDLYHGLGPRGQELVEIMFKGIREGTFPLATEPALAR